MVHGGIGFGAESVARAMACRHRPATCQQAAQGGRGMKALMLICGSGPMLILSSHESLTDDVFLGKLKSKGVDKFIAYELPWDKVKASYGGHFQTVLHDLHETDDLRVLDVNGQRVFNLFRLDELGEPFIYESEGRPTKVYVD
jgi:hypothetical protein